MGHVREAFDDQPQDHKPAVGIAALGAGAKSERLRREQRQIVLQGTQLLFGRRDERRPEEIADTGRHLEQLPHGHVGRGIFVGIIGEDRSDSIVD